MLPTELWIRIALSSLHSLCGEHDELQADTDEYVFNSLVRAIPSLGRWTIAGHNGVIVNRRLDLMITFGYSVEIALELYGDSICWRKNGYWHRNDQPAYIDHRVSEWHQHGQLHRMDGPAVQVNYEWFSWYQHGIRHRDDGPSFIHDNGRVEWRGNGVRYRVAGPAIIHVDGRLMY